MQRREDTRANRAREYENYRHNLASEIETKRSNTVKEGIERYKTDHGVVANYISAAGSAMGGLGRLVGGISGFQAPEISKPKSTPTKIGFN